MLAALVLLGCSGGAELFLPGDGGPARIELVEGKGQSGRVGEPLSDSLVFAVTDSRGRPVEGAGVVFDLGSSAPGMDVVPDTAVTDANGLADVRLVLGTTIGTQTGEARVLVPEGVAEPTTTFSATALSENANEITAVSGDDQSAPAGLVLSQPLVVEVTDAFGNPISGVPITWTALGGGSVSESNNVTDGDGRAAVQRTLGPAAGSQSAIAESPGLAGSPVTFSHLALPGNASSLTLVSGNEQTARVGTRLPADLVVRLLDASGNGIPDAAVTWVVSTGGGSVTPENGTTDEAGYASAQWTLGPSPGPNRLDAVVSGVGVVTFRATGIVGAPAALAIVTQPSSSARNGQPLARQPVVQVRDSDGNNVSTAGIVVTAQLSGGGGELLGTRQRATDGSGRATFTDLAISGAEGNRILVFTASGYAGASSNPIDVDAIGTSTSITSDSPDPSTVGEAVVVGFTVTAERVTPTGSVTVTDGEASCTGTLSGGSGSCSLRLNNSGNRTLRATYNGAAGLNGSSDTESHQVNSAQPPPPAGTTTTINSDNPDPSAEGTQVTVSFTVTSTAGTPTGTVRVTEPNGGNCTGQAPSGSCPLTPGGIGSRLITATYEGNSSFNSSSDTEEHLVTPAQPENEPPDADYNWTCDGLTCRFTNASSDEDGQGLSYRWNFGDGSPESTETNPTHRFPSPGEYQVSLTATDEDGESDNSVAGVDVENSGTETTITSFDPSDPVVGEPVRVSFTVTTDEGFGGPPTGTVTVSTDGSEPGCSVSVAQGSCEVTFLASGDREVTATYSGDNGFEPSSDDADIDVDPAPPQNQPPQASFTSPAQCVVNQPCDFIDTSSDPDGNITTRSWNFGDESSPTSESTHIYQQTGSYSVELTVTDAGALSSTATGNIQVVAQATGQLGMFVQPSSQAVEDQEFDQQPIIQLQRADGSSLAIPGVRVEAEVGSGVGDLDGDRDSTTDDTGQAVFTDLAIDNGTGPHRLVFTADGYASVSSSDISVSPEPDND